MLVAAGCAQPDARRNTEVRKEKMAMGPVILPTEMCAEHGRVAMSADKEGDRMVCELQAILGSHVPRCVCVDEGFSDRERELAFEQLKGLGMINPCGQNADCVMGKIGVSSALGTGTR
jgi:hypothetical protein